MTNSDVLRRLRADLWQSPRAHGEILRDRTVGPLELFYDLVVVVLVAQAAHRLTAHLTPRGVAEFAIVFTLVWIAWLNGTLLHDLHGREDVRSRSAFLAQILLLVPLGAFVPRTGNLHGEAFAVTAALLFLALSLSMVARQSSGYGGVRSAHALVRRYDARFRSRVGRVGIAVG